MSIFFYNLFLTLYSFIARVVSPFNPKAKKWVDGRKRVWDELKEIRGNKKRAWIHCASLGEYEQALPLIEKLRDNHEIILTFFSPSGYELIKKKPEVAAFYLPPDSSVNAKKFLDTVQPALAVFVRYDLWYYYLIELQQRRIQTILISAVFRERDIFFRWYGGLFRKMLKCFTHIFVQNEESRKLLAEHNLFDVTKAGDTRIDRVASIRQNTKEFPVIEKFIGTRKLFIIGSLEPKDESVVFPLINDAEISRHLKFIIAPHNVHKMYVKHVAQKTKGKVVINSETAPDEMMQNDVLIIDSIGMLQGLYRYAAIAYIGGGFGEGLHNVLEPAAFGVPVLFGPKYQKFIEAVEMIKCGGAFEVKDADGLKKQVNRLLSDQKLLEKAGACAQRFIQDNTGGTEIILALLIYTETTQVFE